MTSTPLPLITRRDCVHFRSNGRQGTGPFTCKVGLTSCADACEKFHGPNDRKPRKAPARVELPCIHLGDPTGDTVECPTCKGGRTQLKTFGCNKGHGPCTMDSTRPVEGVQCCGPGRCDDYSARPKTTSILLTGGLGDAIAVEGLMTPEERERLTTIYYACPARHAVSKLFQLLPNFPRLKNHVMLANKGTDGKVYLGKSGVEQDHGVLPPEVQDWSIMKQFHARKPYLGSSFLVHRLADRPVLPKSYAVVVPVSNWGQWEGRNFDDADWQTCFSILEKRQWHGVVLLRDKITIPKHPHLTNLTGQTTAEAAIEILKGAQGYLGIDTWLSVLAAKLFPASSLAIKSVSQHCYDWKEVYFAPRSTFPFLQRRLSAL